MQVKSTLQKNIPGGTVHDLPTDMVRALTAEPTALTQWQDLTPLARNEWICWTISSKQQKTRNDHVRRLIVNLLAGKRRPCCWYGCIHRTDKAISPSVKGILGKK